MDSESLKDFTREELVEKLIKMNEKFKTEQKSKVRYKHGLIHISKIICEDIKTFAQNISWKDGTKEVVTLYELINFLDETEKQFKNEEVIKEELSIEQEKRNQDFLRRKEDKEKNGETRNHYKKQHRH